MFWLTVAYGTRSNIFIIYTQYFSISILDMY